jgi:hypothetical protein
LKNDEEEAVHFTPKNMGIKSLREKEEDHHD